MRISKYATVFRSASNTPYVYNALSNRLFRIDESIFQQIGAKDIGTDDTIITEELAGLFVDDLLFSGEVAEQKELKKRQAMRTSACEADSHIDLSICPTLHCNFRCDYCFESDQHTTNKMTPETVDNLFKFIDSIDYARTIGISWYGGEPLVGFAIMRDITSRLLKGKLEFQGAGLITNGYLLTKEKISLLNEMKITSIQVTLDGPESIHDSRRYLASGKPTFRRILTNLDTLFTSDFSGSCNIRVNLDKENLGLFQELQSFLMTRYAGNNVSVYGGRVERLCGIGASCDSDNLVTSVDWTDHLLEQSVALYGKSSEQLYPISNEANICTATMRNSYVVGPRGELYKCWEDVGNAEFEVGNVNDRVPKQPESDVEEMYTVAADPYLDKYCQQCNTLPICGGGCANRRLRKLFFKDDDIDFCSLYKDHLVEFLKAVVQKEEQIRLCKQLLDDVDDTNSGVSELVVVDTGRIIGKY